jgi:tRNA(Arg) A34 adenosine deaminase TadA
VPTFSELDRELMAIALDEAARALAHDDVPIGAVIAVGDRVIARRHNERERTGDPTAHAEVLALRDAAEVLGGWRFDGATMVVTIEPCVMCAGPRTRHGCHGWCSAPSISKPARSDRSTTWVSTRGSITSSPSMAASWPIECGRWSRSSSPASGLDPR